MVDIKEVAKKVIADEALAIQNLARFIDDDFEKVVRLIYNTKGRVIVTGIGKSAIIAQKIVLLSIRPVLLLFLCMRPTLSTVIWG